MSDEFITVVLLDVVSRIHWGEALKGWWLEAHARAVRRGTLQLPTVLGPAPAPELPPLYDAELHAQMQADIARLCGPVGPLMSGMNDNQRLRRGRGSSILAAEGTARERDPAYLAQMQARKAMLRAQAVWLQAQASDLEGAGAAD